MKVLCSHSSLLILQLTILSNYVTFVCLSDRGALLPHILSAYLKLTDNMGWSVPLPMSFVDDHRCSTISVSISGLHLLNSWSGNIFFPSTLGEMSFFVIISRAFNFDWWRSSSSITLDLKLSLGVYCLRGIL